MVGRVLPLMSSLITLSALLPNYLSAEQVKEIAVEFPSFAPEGTELL